MRKAWLLFLLLGVAGTVLGIKYFHQQDVTEAISTSICLECVGTRIVGNEIVYQKGIEIGFRKGRFDILTEKDVLSIKESLASGKKRITLFLFSANCDGCLFYEKLTQEISSVNPLFLKLELVRDGSEGFEEARGKYGFAGNPPLLLFIDGYGNVMETIEGMENLKERVMQAILRLEGIT